MIIYLAGEAYGRDVFARVNHKFNRLDSFWYNTKSPWQREYRYKYDRYMLDSGAFTFIMDRSGGSKMTGNTSVIHSFTDEYIDYINEYKVDLFFEMDVDSVFGYKLVKELRERIEARTGKQAIPVYHMSRGPDDWDAMCKDYTYIALGIAGKDVKLGDHQSFRTFVDDAHARGCKVHGLGITGMRSLSAVPFDSVDSSSWTTGNRYKTVYRFDGRYVKPMNSEVKGMRIKDQRKLAAHNLTQWIKFSRSMEHKRTI